MKIIEIREFGLHLEIVIDDDGRHFFVEDHVSGTKAPIYLTPDGWADHDIIRHVKDTLAIARREITASPLRARF